MTADDVYFEGITWSMSCSNDATSVNCEVEALDVYLNLGSYQSDGVHVEEYQLAGIGSAGDIRSFLKKSVVDVMGKDRGGKIMSWVATMEKKLIAKKDFGAYRVEYHGPMTNGTIDITAE